MKTKVCEAKPDFYEWTGADWANHLAEIVFRDPPNSKHTSFSLNWHDFDLLLDYLKTNTVVDWNRENLSVAGVKIVRSDKLSRGECWGRFN